MEVHHQGWWSDTDVTDTIKGHRQRLKERFLAGEQRALGDEALLELLLTYAIPQKDVRPLAERLLAADDVALRDVDGIGEQCPSTPHRARA